MLKSNTIYQGNALELLKQIKGESAGLFFTDPPFNISNNVKIRRGSNKDKFSGSDLNYNFGEWDNFESPEAFWEFTEQWLNEAARILVPGGTFITYFDRDRVNEVSQHLQKEFDFKIRGYIADIKTNPVPQARKVKWSNGWEIMALLTKPPHETKSSHYQWQEGQHPDFFIRPVLGGNERLKHPCQKPLLVANDIVRWWSKPDDLVVDPFAGTGSFLVAAKMQGRSYIGIEADPTYIAMAEKRLSQDLLF